MRTYYLNCFGVVVVVVKELQVCDKMYYVVHKACHVVAL